jgi:ABC-type polysaccharide/polyol phosphate transport system ATPase subunit
MIPVIDFQNVSKHFIWWFDRPNNIKKFLSELITAKPKLGRKQRIDVLKDVSFKIYPGDFVGIMGRNGAGKSTLLKLITGIYSPNSGSIKTVGRIAPLLELGAGFSDELSGLENIFLNAAILGYGRRQTQEKLDTIVSFSELGEHIHMPVRTYSSGMLVRLGFSIAVHLDSPIFLFDEILAVGDAGFQKKCLSRINELYLAGKSIILVTHSPEQIRTFCNRCILIDHHNVIYDGPPEEGTKMYSELFL